MTQLVPSLLAASHRLSVYRQNTTNTNTNAYQSQGQNTALSYEWKATYTSGTEAGLYLFASAATGAERGNSYRVWQDATHVRLYENASNVATLLTSFAAANALGQAHSYKVSYDPQTGKFDLWRDGVYLGMWQDATPLTTGAYISLRTVASDVLFDNLAVNDYHFTRTFVGSHYEKMTTAEDFGDGQAQGWTAASGTWAVSGGGYRQSTTNTNTNAYQSQGQNTALSYEWTATYTSGTEAGLYLFASAATGAERGNSYRVWQDATHVCIFKAANDSAGSAKISFAAANALGQAHSYKVSYDPQTGKFDLWRDGASLGTWTDTSSPLTTGGYISLRTDASNVLFDNILMTRESKYYAAGGVRVAMWEPEMVFFLLSNQLGSTATVADLNGNETGKLLYKPWGETRYSSGNTPTTTYRSTGERQSFPRGTR